MRGYNNRKKVLKTQAQIIVNEFLKNHNVTIVNKLVKVAHTKVWQIQVEYNSDIYALSIYKDNAYDLYMHVYRVNNKNGIVDKTFCVNKLSVICEIAKEIFN